MKTFLKIVVAAALAASIAGCTAPARKAAVQAGYAAGIVAASDYLDREQPMADGKMTKDEWLGLGSKVAFAAAKASALAAFAHRTLEAETLPSPEVYGK